MKDMDAKEAESNEGATHEGADAVTYEQLAYDSFVRRRQGSVGTTLPERVGRFEFEPADRKLIQQADSFFLSTVTGAGWPYVQHRGGPKGFVHVLDDRTIGWLEFMGNNQYVSTGNIDRDGRVALFFINYPLRTRLKVFGYARVIELCDDPKIAKQLRNLGDKEIRSKSERAMIVDIVASDKNCTKHIRPRWDKEQVDERIALYRADIDELRNEISELKERNNLLNEKLDSLG